MFEEAIRMSGCRHAGGGRAWYPYSYILGYFLRRVKFLMGDEICRIGALFLQHLVCHCMWHLLLGNSFPWLKVSCISYEMLIHWKRHFRTKFLPCIFEDTSCSMWMMQHCRRRQLLAIRRSSDWRGSWMVWLQACGISIGILQVGS